jgi:uncharacterized membrane protein
MPRLLTFAAVHLVIAFSLSYALTGSIAIAGAITFVEPIANTLALWALDRFWGTRHPQAPSRAQA